MVMKLTPLFNSAGQLLGHIDLNRCYHNRDHYVIDEHAGRVEVYTGTNVSDTVRIFQFPIKRIRFRWDYDEQVVRYMVVDDPIPEWVWKVGGVKFSEDDWERG